MKNLRWINTLPQKETELFRKYFTISPELLLPMYVFSMLGNFEGTDLLRITNDCQMSEISEIWLYSLVIISLVIALSLSILLTPMRHLLWSQFVIHI